MFRIAEVKHTTDPPHYKIEDLNGQAILGVFYNEELSATRITPNARIGEILQIKRRPGRGTRLRQFLVHWVGEGLEEDQGYWIVEPEEGAGVQIENYILLDRYNLLQPATPTQPQQ